MPKINRISTLQYLGSKNRMLENICIPIIEDTSIDKVVDLFAGTGIVGYALSPYKAIISNDSGIILMFLMSQFSMAV